MSSRSVGIIDTRGSVNMWKLVLFFLTGAAASRKKKRPAAEKEKRGVLVNTPGGSASTLILEALYKSGVPTNNRFNVEGNLKHGNADLFRDRLDDGCIVAREQATMFKFDRVLYMISKDAAKALVSTARRWPKMQHQFNLIRGCDECYRPPPARRSRFEANRAKIPPPWRDKTGIELYKAIFASASKLGRDAYGIQAHFDSWVRAQNESAWPPILIADVGTLVDDAFHCVLFNFLGITTTEQQRSIVQAMKHPDNLVVKLNQHHPGEHKVISTDYMDAKARLIYSNLSNSIQRIVQQNREYYERKYSLECQNSSKYF